MSLLDPHFLAALMTSAHGKHYFTSTSQQTTNLATTNVSKLKQFPLFLPPIAEQRQMLSSIHRQTDRLETLIRHVEDASRKLQEYRTALISAAVIGKIDVREKAAS
jgi:restriction endonuclease S subunit